MTTLCHTTWIKSNKSMLTSLKTLVPFQEIHTTSTWTPPCCLCEYLVGQCTFTNKKSLSVSFSDMEQAGVVVPVNQATAWILSYIIVESEDKRKKMCICLDPTPLNKAVLREPFYCCTPDDSTTNWLKLHVLQSLIL